MKGVPNGWFDGDCVGDKGGGVMSNECMFILCNKKINLIDH